MVDHRLHCSGRATPHDLELRRYSRHFAFGEGWECLVRYVEPCRYFELRWVYRNCEFSWQQIIKTKDEWMVLRWRIRGEKTECLELLTALISLMVEVQTKLHQPSPFARCGYCDCPSSFITLRPYHDCITHVAAVLFLLQSRDISLLITLPATTKNLNPLPLVFEYAVLHETTTSLANWTSVRRSYPRLHSPVIPH